MSRFRRVVHGVASGYLLLGVTAVYGLAMLPLGLHYLSEKRMGLWTLMAGVWSYFSLIDLGITGSLGRLLVDHKDEPSGGEYGGLLKTGWLALAIQGAIVGIAGYILAPLLPPSLKLDDWLRPDFISLMRWQTTALAVSFCMKIFLLALMAHQRSDLVNYFQMINLALSLLVLWWLFHTGHGVTSLAWSTLFGTCANAILAPLACLSLGLLPAPGAWGRVSRRHFREMFAFGKDMFLVSLGHQLIMASQTFIITRELGVAACTLWYAGTRVFTLVNQVIWRVSDFSMPAFAEMMVRKETGLLKARYENVFVLTASLAGFCGITYILCNSDFVQVWSSLSKKEILYWPSRNDVLLGIWMLVMALLHCHNLFVLTTKEIKFMRYIYFVEGLLFVVLGAAATKVWGLAGLIGASIACSAALTCSYGTWRVARYFAISSSTIALRWTWPMIRVIAAYGAIALLAGWAFARVPDFRVRLALRVCVAVLAGVPILLRLGIPDSLRGELLARSPGFARPVLRSVFGV